MREAELTKFLVSITGQIEYVRFPAGVFDEGICVQYEAVWGPDWSLETGLASGVSQIAHVGSDPERVVLNMPLELLFSSTNVSGWPQLVITVRRSAWRGSTYVCGYGILLTPPTCGTRVIEVPIFKPRPATLLGEWFGWITGRVPELVDPKMLANGKDNYLLRMESYGSVTARLSMISKDMHKLGYDNKQNQPFPVI